MSNGYPQQPYYPYYYPYRPDEGGGVNWAAMITGLAALGIGSYAVYWLWKNGYFNFGCKSDADCATGYKCVNGKCLKDVCYSDDDCPASYKCINGVCKPSTSCTTNEDCPPNQYCVNKKCVQCRTTDDCQDGYKCVNNICVPDTPETFDIIGNAVWTREEGGVQVPHGPLAGVLVTAKNLGTNQTWQATSDSNGDWGFTGVPEGFYSVVATKTGAYRQVGSFPYVQWDKSTGYYPGLVINTRSMFSTLEYYGCDDGECAAGKFCCADFICQNIADKTKILQIYEGEPSFICWRQNNIRWAKYTFNEQGKPYFRKPIALNKILGLDVFINGTQWGYWSGFVYFKYNGYNQTLFGEAGLEDPCIFGCSDVLHLGDITCNFDVCIDELIVGIMSPTGPPDIHGIKCRFELAK